MQTPTKRIFVQEVTLSRLNRSRVTRIFLPKAYYRFPEKRFPVVYMLDGQNVFDHSTSYSHPWRVHLMVDSLPLKDQLIIVGIDNGHKQRSIEYLPVSKNGHLSEGDDFLHSIVFDLKPKVDLHLRTLTDQSNTWIVGSSLGGLLAFYAGTRWSHIFGKIGVFSPAFWFAPGIFNFHPSVISKVYVVGSKTESRGMASTLGETYRQLKSHGYPDNKIRVVLRNRGKHNEIFWGRQMRGMIEWMGD